MIKKKLISGYVLIAGLMFLFLIVCSYFLLSTQNELNTSFKKPLELIEENRQVLAKVAIVEREIHDSLLTGEAPEISSETWEGDYAAWFEQVESTVIVPLNAGDRDLAEEQWRERSAEAATLQKISEEEMTAAYESGLSTLGETSSTMTKQLAVAWILFFIFTIIGSLVARRQARMVLVPLKRLIRRANHLAEGDFSRKPIPVYVNDEFGSFTISFNEMTNPIIVRGPNGTNTRTPG